MSMKIKHPVITYCQSRFDWQSCVNIAVAVDIAYRIGEYVIAHISR